MVMTFCSSPCHADFERFERYRFLLANWQHLGEVMTAEEIPGQAAQRLHSPYFTDCSKRKQPRQHRASESESLSTLNCWVLSPDLKLLIVDR